jgi:hypothetical protein
MITFAIDAVGFLTTAVLRSLINFIKYLSAFFVSALCAVEELALYRKEFIFRHRLVKDMVFFKTQIRATDTIVAISQIIAKRALRAIMTVFNLNAFVTVLTVNRFIAKSASVAYQAVNCAVVSHGPVAVKCEFAFNSEGV